MKILMVLDREFPPDIRVENEIEALSDNGHEIHLACYTRQNRPQFEKKDKLIIHRKKISTFLYKSSVAALIFPFYFHFWKNFLSKILAKEKFDTIHIHDLPLVGVGIKMKKQFSVSITADLHENWPAYLRIARHTKTLPGRILSPNKLWVKHEKKILSESDQIIVVADEAKTRLISKGIDATRIKIVSNTLNIKHFTLPEKKKENSETILFYAGGIQYHRGLHTVIKALAKTENKNLKFWILGEGVEKKNLKKLTNTLNLANSVKFFGWKSFDEMIELLSQADIAMIPHIKSDHTDTTIPHKLFQYMFAGVPVIATNCIPIKRVIDETQSGVCYASNDDKELAAIFDSISPKDQIILGDNGKKWVIKKYNWENEAKSLNQIYS
ncbi:MAG: glycosyltransferase family 4 protein [Bacteroidetes bacterium]|nr:glycosyltransferase family 4 protein [Bacteroidota bacterium]